MTAVNRMGTVRRLPVTVSSRGMRLLLIALLGAAAATLGALGGSAHPPRADAAADQVPLSVPSARFFGSVTFNGLPAQAGLPVTATAYGAVCGTGYSSGGQYYIDVAAAAPCDVPGTPVAFSVGGYPAAQTAVIPDLEGTAVEVDLSAYAPYAPPTYPPPPPTTAPPPPYGYAPTAQAPTLVSPQPGSVLYSPTVTFAWTPAYGVDRYRLYVGSRPGADDIFRSERLNGATTGITVNGIPLNGETIWVRLRWHDGSGWQYTDYSFTAA